MDLLAWIAEEDGATSQVCELRLTICRAPEASPFQADCPKAVGLLCLDGAPTALLLPGPPAPGWGSLSVLLYASDRGGKTGWDLGPSEAGLPCLHLDTTSLKQQNMRKKKKKTRMGLKITNVHAVGANSGPKDTKTKEPQLPLLKGLEQKRGLGASRVLSAPCTRHYKRVGRLLSHPPARPGTHPTLTPWKEQACPLTTAEAPVKPCLDFLSGL